MQVWKSEMRKVSELIPHERNPRKISPERLKKLAERIKSQGFRVPPCLDNDGVILTGHQRVRALIDMGLGDLDIPVSIPTKKLTEKQRKEIVASDNISWGEYDFEMLHEDYTMEELIDYGMDNITIEDPEVEEADAHEGSTMGCFKVSVDGDIVDDITSRFNALISGDKTGQDILVEMIKLYESKS